MVNKKGFTLVEILAVIAILATLLLIIVPKVSNLLTDSKEKAYNVQIQEIESAAESWVSLNIYNMPTEDYAVKVSVLQLKLANLLSYDITNPITGVLFPDDMLVEITKNGQVLKYTVDEDSGTTNENYNSSYPELILYGSIEETIEVNSVAIYTDLGVSAKKSTGEAIDSGLISKEIKYRSNATIPATTIVSEVDTSEIGIYTITYSVTDNGLTSKISRIVSIVDTTLPVIAIKEKNSETEYYENGEYILIEAQSGYTLQADDMVVITDNSGELLSYEIEGNFSSIIPGKKNITYKATDSSGNTGIFNLTYEIVDTTSPTFISMSSSVATSGKKIVTIEATDLGVGLGNYAYSFDGGTTWSKDNSYVYDGNESLNFLIKDKAGNIKNVTEYYTLSVDPAGGVWNTYTSTQYFYMTENQKIEIIDSNLDGNIFSSWSTTGTGSSIDGFTFVMGSSNSTLTAEYSLWFSYTGTYALLDDGDDNWRVKFLTTGIFTPFIDVTVDAFLVGGGSAGTSFDDDFWKKGGGGGGYTATHSTINLTANSSYSITIGFGGNGRTGTVDADLLGGESSAFGYTVSGGIGMEGGSGGGNGGYTDNGGDGGSNGGNGQSTEANRIGYGQIAQPGPNGETGTTREFGEATGALYAGGGGGGGGYDPNGQINREGGLGGAGGGGNGAGGTLTVEDGEVNTGGGAGSCIRGRACANGGSGIVIIRNAR